MNATLRIQKEFKKLLVFREVPGQSYGCYVDSIYYDNLDEVDISHLWDEPDAQKYEEFQKDFLIKLKSVAKGFIISKSRISLCQKLNQWAKELGYKPVQLKLQKDFDPNEFFWGWKF